jgi:hypothetical protein
VGQPGPRIAARHIPHRDEQHPVRIAGFEHRNDVRIIHGRRTPGFTNEAVPECLIRRQRRREDLERYLPLEPLILGPEYNRHSSLADLLFQTVPRDPGTDGEAGQEPEGPRPLIAHHASSTRTLSSLASLWRLSGVSLASGVAGADNLDEPATS